MNNLCLAHDETLSSVFGNPISYFYVLSKILNIVFYIFNISGKEWVGTNLKKSLQVSIALVIASTYSILTVFLGEFGYSWLQIRISEALTPLPFLMGFPAVAGLTTGCIIANLLSPIGLPDMIFGPLLTFCAAFFSWKVNFGRKIIACIYPVLLNAFGVSLYVSSFYGVPYGLSAVTIALGEFISAVIIGYPLLVAIEKKVTGSLPIES